MKPLIYVEYLRRDRAIPAPVFRHHAKQDWQAEGDVMVGNLARTMKIGPEPHHICLWRIASIKRMDEWEDFFRTAEGRAYVIQSPVAAAVDFYQCGLFDIIIEPDIAPGELALVEFFAPGEATADQLARDFRQREANFAGARQTGLLTRLGLMGPEPGGIALWSFRNYTESEPFLRAQNAKYAARIEAAGFYRPLGEDIA